MDTRLTPMSSALDSLAAEKNDFVDAVVDGDRGGVRFDGELEADIARWHAVTVAVE